MKYLLCLVIGFGLFFHAQNLLANEGHDHAAQAMGSIAENSQATTTQAIEVGNKICPVSGEKVGGMGEAAQYEYNGKIYNLCCLGCEKDFKKNPEKYSKIAEEEAAKDNDRR